MDLSVRLAVAYIAGDRRRLVVTGEEIAGQFVGLRASRQARVGEKNEEKTVVRGVPLARHGAASITGGERWPEM
jgi:hypothetical protein